jgi:hypothetical protein
MPRRLGVVVQACYPNYLGGEYLEDLSLRPALTKSLQDLISTNGWAQWCVPVISGTTGKLKLGGSGPD